jgi:hypothetical protein
MHTLKTKAILLSAILVTQGFSAPLPPENTPASMPKPSLLQSYDALKNQTSKLMEDPHMDPLMAIALKEAMKSHFKSPARALDASASNFMTVTEIQVEKLRAFHSIVKAARANDINTFNDLCEKFLTRNWNVKSSTEKQL